MNSGYYTFLASDNHVKFWVAVSQSAFERAFPPTNRANLVDSIIIASGLRLNFVHINNLDNEESLEHWLRPVVLPRLADSILVLDLLDNTYLPALLVYNVALKSRPVGFLTPSARIRFVDGTYQRQILTKIFSASVLAAKRLESLVKKWKATENTVTTTSESPQKESKCRLVAGNSPKLHSDLTSLDNNLEPKKVISKTSIIFDAIPKVPQSPKSPQKNIQKSPQKIRSKDLPLDSPKSSSSNLTILPDDIKSYIESSTRDCVSLNTISSSNSSEKQSLSLINDSKSKVTKNLVDNLAVNAESFIELRQQDHIPYTPLEEPACFSRLVKLPQVSSSFKTVTAQRKAVHQMPNLEFRRIPVDKPPAMRIRPNENLNQQITKSKSKGVILPVYSDNSSDEESDIAIRPDSNNDSSISRIISTMNGSVEEDYELNCEIDTMDENIFSTNNILKIGAPVFTSSPISVRQASDSDNEDFSIRSTPPSQKTPSDTRTGLRIPDGLFLSTKNIPEKAFAQISKHFRNKHIRNKKESQA